MKTIDFLPQTYRNKSARHRAGVWRLLVVALLGGAVGLASVAQFIHHRSIRAQLDELQPLFADAQAKTAVLAQTQTELARETAAATLYAHLQMPWPRTQLVSALASPVGKGVRIEQIHLTETAAPTLAAATTENLSAPPPLNAMSPATRDLAAIRDEVATRTTHAEIVGTSEQAADIHDYLAQLESSPLVERAELVSLENVTVEGQPRQLRFTAQVKVRPRGCAESPPAATAGESLTQATPHAP